jgi:hypothetical protein
VTKLRVLTDEGIRRFTEYLDELRLKRDQRPPFYLLEDKETSAPLSAVTIDPAKKLATRRDAALYLGEVLGQLNRGEVDHNAGLWSWLALLYFDRLCPIDEDGKRKPGATPRYVLPPVDHPEHYQRYYRHLLAGPYTIARLHPAGATLLLASSIAVFDDFNEQIASRQEMVTNAGIVQAVDLLYLDTAKGRAKRGAQSTKRKPGTLRRFVDVYQQLDLTYDLYSMTGEDILRLLPAEFTTWKPEEFRV